MTTEVATTYRSGFAAIIGKPNAGKSTLLNALVGEKIAAVSPLPQTTQKRLNGIYSDDERQIVFVDLPGIVAPNDALNTCLVENIGEGLDGVDVALHLIDVNDRAPVDEAVVGVLRHIVAPVILVVNKLDAHNATTDAAEHAAKLAAPFDPSIYRSIMGVSAREPRGLNELVAAIHPFLPAGPPLFDRDQLVDAPMRELAAEMIREKAFLNLRNELPYAVAVEIEEFTEHPAPRKWYIRATIHVERESQKGILIGAGGNVLKQISTAARTDIERLAGTGVFLELWVKVRKNWKNNENDLRAFGLKPKKRKRG